MTGDPRDFVHERFRHIDAKLDRILASNEATNVRLTSMERRLTALDGSIVEVHERMDGMQGQLDSIGRRLDRIERRLELSDAPQA
jgi:predicted  nucleic acid-binding Zn-ribbon protein